MTALIHWNPVAKFEELENGVASLFGRNFSLSDEADANKIEARLKDGQLKIHPAKDELAEPKQIEVKGANAPRRSPTVNKPLSPQSREPAYCIGGIAFGCESKQRS